MRRRKALAAFIARAVELGRDPQALAAVCELPRRRRDDGLFDMHGFARDCVHAIPAMVQT